MAALTLREIVARLGGEAVGDAPGLLTGVATLDSAGPGEIAFLSNPRYRPQLATTRAGAVIVAPRDREALTGAGIVTDNPYVYYAHAVTLFNPPSTAMPGVHPSAVVMEGARVDPSAEVGPGAVIGPRSSVGPRARIGAHAVLGKDAHVGADTEMHAHVTLYDGCRVGERCILHAGVVIGADGFGMAREGDHWVKIPQVGTVRVGNDVEIGANTTIDRGALDDTVIGDGVKLDNQIQIGHNCVIGAHTVIAGCTGISGSVTIGRDCVIGGAVAIGGHISIADGVTITGMSRVTKTILKPGTYSSGSPLMPHQEWLRNSVHLRRLDRIARQAAGTPPKEDRGTDDDD